MNTSCTYHYPTINDIKKLLTQPLTREVELFPAQKVVDGVKFIASHLEVLKSQRRGTRIYNMHALRLRRYYNIIKNTPDEHID